MTPEKIIKFFRLAFAFLFGCTLMCYAGYAWHMEWLADWQAIIAGLFGFVLMFIPNRLKGVISQGLGKIFDATIGRFFGNQGNKPTN